MLGAPSSFPRIRRAAAVLGSAAAALALAVAPTALAAGSSTGALPAAASGAASATATAAGTSASAVGASAAPTAAIPAGAVWVSPTAAAGGTGSQASPVRDLKAAVSQAGKGGTVVLESGTYRVQNLTIDQPRLTLTAAPGATPVLEGADSLPATRWTHSGSAWTATGLPAMCDDCTVNPDSAAEGMAAHPEQVVVGGKALTQVASRSEVTAGTFAVEKDGSTSTYILGSDPTAGALVSTRTRALTVTADDVTLRGITVRDYAPAQSWKAVDASHGSAAGPAAVLVTGKRATITGLTVARTSGGIGLHIGAAGATVSASTFTDNGGTAVNANRADGLVLERLLITGSNAAGYLTATCGAYCTVAHIKTTHTSGVSLRDSVIEGASPGTDELRLVKAKDQLPGFWCDEGCIGSTVTGTAFKGVPEAIVEEVSSRAVIASNVIAGSGTGVLVSGSDRVRIWSNTVSGTWRPIVLREDPRHGGCQDATTATTAGASGTAACTRVDEWSASHGLTWDTTGAEIVDNILSSRPTVADSALVGAAPALVTVKEGRNADGSLVPAARIVSRIDGNAYYRSSLENDPGVIRWDTTASGGTSKVIANVEDVATALPSSVEGREEYGIEATGASADNPYLRNEPAGDLRTDPTGPAATGAVALSSDVSAALTAGGITAPSGTALARGAIDAAVWHEGGSFGASASQPGIAAPSLATRLGRHRAAAVGLGLALAAAVVGAVWALVRRRRHRASGGR